MNPLRTPQDVRVELVGLGIVRTLTLAPRSRQAVELGTWGAAGDFGVEVRCGSVCASSLTMWDAGLKDAHESIPLVGCEVPQ
jgi:hypothetical protein